MSRLDELTDELRMLEDDYNTSVDESEDERRAHNALDLFRYKYSEELKCCT